MSNETQPRRPKGRLAPKKTATRGQSYRGNLTRKPDQPANGVTNRELRFDDDALAATMLATFPGSQSLGIRPQGSFKGPMLPSCRAQLPKRRSSLLPDDNSPRPITEADIGERFLAALRWEPKQ